MAKEGEKTITKQQLKEEIRSVVQKALFEAHFKKFDEEHIVKEDLHNVIHKVGDKWKIRGHHGDWDATYDSKQDAEDGLKAYFANKNESIQLDKDDLMEIASDVMKEYIIRKKIPMNESALNKFFC